MKGSHITFGKGGEVLLILESSDCYARPKGKNEVIYFANLEAHLAQRIIGQPIELLKNTDMIQIQFLPMPHESNVLFGQAICTFNNLVQVEIKIPPQKTSKGVIFMSNLKEVFSKFPE